MSDRYCVGTTISAVADGPGLEVALKAAAAWVEDNYGDGMQFGSIFHVEVGDDDLSGWYVTIYHDGSNKQERE